VYFDCKYDTFFLLGDPDAEPLWNWRVWSRAAEALDPIIKSARGRASVRSIQYLPDKKRTAVKFGRIGWNKKGHQKWAHGSPANHQESALWRFSGIEVWAPTWNVCEREDLAPDVFLEVSNHGLYPGNHEPLSFNPVVVFAVTASLSTRIPSKVQHAVTELLRLTNARLAGSKRRPWGLSRWPGIYENCIQDLCSSQLFKSALPNERKFGFNIIEGKWKPIEL
jgi:hypothetical protein